MFLFYYFVYYNKTKPMMFIRTMDNVMTSIE